MGPSRRCSGRDRASGRVRAATNEDLIDGAGLQAAEAARRTATGWSIRRPSLAAWRKAEIWVHPPTSMRGWKAARAWIAASSRISRPTAPNAPRRGEAVGVNAMGTGVMLASHPQGRYHRHRSSAWGSHGVSHQKLLAALCGEAAMAERSQMRSAGSTRLSRTFEEERARFDALLPAQGILADLPSACGLRRRRTRAAEPRGMTA